MLNRWANRIERWLDLLIGAMLAATATCMALQVFSRYLLNWSPNWSEEVARFLMFWMTFLGAAAVLRSGGHIAVTSALLAARPGLRRWLLALRDLAIFGTFVILAINGWRFAEMNMTQESPAMEIPMGLAYGALFVGATLMALLLALARLGGETIALTEDNSTGL